jgi:hypothetical protein
MRYVPEKPGREAPTNPSPRRIKEQSMTTSEAGLRDGVQVHVNGADVDTVAQIPDRPADDAPDSEWVDYVVALGADRAFLVGETEHYDADFGERVPGAALSRTELAELASRLGG